MVRNTTPTVDAIEQLHISGNVIPKEWYQTLTYTNKRGTYPHLLAINILAELIYWYRPKVEYSQSGKVLSVSKRFGRDKLQKSYKQLSDLFGCSHKLAREAIQFLVERGVISTELRTVRTGGSMLPNTMFIDLNIEAIRSITYLGVHHAQLGGTTELGKTLPPSSVRPSPRIGQDPPPELGKTLPPSSVGIHRVLTDTTTNNSTNTTSELNKDIDYLIEKFNEYCDRQARPTTKSYRTVIGARLKEYTVQELEEMIMYKAVEWGNDQKMQNYLEIPTLFRASNCPKYVEAAIRFKNNPDSFKAIKKKAQDQVSLVDRSILYR